MSNTKDKQKALIVAGTYERTLCGWRVEGDEAATPVFNHPAHLGPIKAVAISGKYLVSGGNDEEIRIFNTRKLVEVGNLMRHQGPITSLKFFGSFNLVSSSDDGTMLIWRCKDWECLSTLRGHKGGVIDHDIHDSGKVLISCGRDNTIRLWDLVKGSLLHTRKRESKGYGSFQCIRWIPKSEGFCSIIGNSVEIYDANSDTPTSNLAHSRTPLTATFYDANTLLTGGEDKIVRVWDVRNGKTVNQLPQMSSRIRSISIESLTNSVITACSDGDIQMNSWSNSDKVLWKESTRARITCACSAITEGAEEAADVQSGMQVAMLMLIFLLGAG
ncbi:hypothetical protein GUITHDRAFT_150348 [Guillardia theta CCMP2712]|uniref:Uncharacterized protein n=1 Tax=Guillardia theta (strain CCMP2712) TaxID=905079 RepID=L1JXC1_GUITC|nr:hypothetical protein GUITHDRAFT_150348 [Guillardia theta CCMP2712]EKX53226.1 hypothetical protein GUITHDRAFT_150348 [Guillardia theta CCMP2712]|eukprot:XP_005840206.1 hypothetical protein GUITHDRAFT_150348 [Guillardia theta CCMP2712]